jgi:hypothetical protein
MWIPHPEYLGLSETETETERPKIYREIMALSLSAEVFQEISHCLDTGLVLGTEALRDQVKALRN